MLKKNTIYQAFAHPALFRTKLLQSQLITGDKSEFSGKTFMCLHVTRFCPVKCKFCFFKSSPVFKKPSIEDGFDPVGFEKLKTFANTIDLGYLLVSGGGEPMMEKKQILSIIREFKAERIVLVTSGNWAKSEKQAQSYVADIIEAIKSRTFGGTVTLRISVDADHRSSLELSPAINLVRLFTQCEIKNSRSEEVGRSKKRP